MEKTPKRPRDVSQLAKRIVDISTEQVDDETEAPDPAAVKRGKARAEKLTPEERREIAKKAAAARGGGRNPKRRTKRKGLGEVSRAPGGTR